MSDQQPPRVIVCCGDSCDVSGTGSRIYAHLQAILDEYDFFDPPFKLRTANCLDMCKQGPNMVIYPGNRRYSTLTPEQAEAILRAEVLTEDAATPEESASSPRRS
jgi:(2Fe-2S) ferredoxin